MTPEHTVKGLFFARFVDEAWASVAPKLIAPPPNGKYHAFEAYPTSDYLRLFDRVARARLPAAVREAYRLLARGEVEVFAGTTLGKVTFSMLGEPGAALLRYPELSRVLARGPSVEAVRKGPNRVVITQTSSIGAAEHFAGMLEGIVMAFEATPVVHIESSERRTVTFTVEW